VRVVLLQLRVDDSEPAFDRVLRVVSLVKAQAGADLVVLPELWVPGAFGYHGYEASATVLPGGVVAELALAAKEIDAYVVAGTVIERDGDHYVVNGRKWWISGAADERCRVFIVMGKTDPDAPPHRQQSMILVPRDAPGLTIVRHLPIFGYQDQHGHSELAFDNVRVPVTSLLAGEGDGFMIAQARLGPGRIHHAMRAIGMAERALSLMVERAKSRVAFGQPLIDQGGVQDLIAQSRIEIEQARLLVLKTAWLIDAHGAKGARTEIAAIKVAAPAVATAVIDRAIEVFGGAGVSDDFPLAYFYAWARVLRIVDGPDAVHRRSVAREEAKRVSPALKSQSELSRTVAGCHWHRPRSPSSAPAVYSRVKPIGVPSSTVRLTVQRRSCEIFSASGRSARALSPSSPSGNLRVKVTAMSASRLACCSSLTLVPATETRNESGSARREVSTSTSIAVQAPMAVSSSSTGVKVSSLPLPTLIVPPRSFETV